MFRTSSPSPLEVPSIITSTNFSSWHPEPLCTCTCTMWTPRMTTSKGNGVKPLRRTALHQNINRVAQSWTAGPQPRWPATLTHLSFRCRAGTVDLKESPATSGFQQRSYCINHSKCSNIAMQVREGYRSKDWCYAIHVEICHWFDRGLPLFNCNHRLCWYSTPPKLLGRALEAVSAYFLGQANDNKGPPYVFFSNACCSFPLQAVS